jgi:hypothetical protein
MTEQLRTRLSDHKKKFWFQKYLMAPLIAFGAVLIINYASLEFNQFWSAWLYSIPFMLFPIMVTLYYYPLQGTSNRNAIAGLAGTTGVAVILLLPWLMTIYFLLTFTNLGFWASVGYAFLVWGFLSMIYFFVMCGSPIVHKLGYQHRCINVGGAEQGT